MKKFIVAGLLTALVIAGVAWRLVGHSTSDPANITLHGNVDIRQVSLAFNESGRVKQLLVQEGDRVKTGQVLGYLDTESLEIQARQATARLAAQEQSVQEQQAGARPAEIAQARAQLSSAQAQRLKARQDLQRIQRIAGDTGGKGISQQELDTARSNLQVAEASVRERQASLNLMQEGARAEQRKATLSQADALKADLELLNYRLSQGELHAPVDAVVRARLVEPGDMASPQKSVFTLALDDPKWVRVWLSESDLGRVREGMTANVTTDTHPANPVKGKVSYISSVAEFTPKSVQTEDLRTNLVYEVRVLVDDPENTLRMGQPATVVIATDGKSQAATAHE